MHTITERTATQEELRTAKAYRAESIASYGCIVLLFGVVAVWILGVAGGWIGGWIGGSAPTYGRYAGWGLGVAFLVAAVVSFRRFERPRRARAAKDEEARRVQDIHVVEPRVVEIALINDIEPTLCFDIGDRRILYLRGQWLRDPDTYGVAPPEGDPPDDRINGLEDPNGFPSTEFIVSRLPESGLVLRIQSKGNYLPPERTVEALKPEYQFSDSELLSGELDAIAQVLAEEHERRRHA